jgi:hypothetical protein
MRHEESMTGREQDSAHREVGKKVQKVFMDGSRELPQSVSDEDLSELLHGLNNVLVSVLLNAQVIECKLPSYARIKRNLHEIERSAQRGAELVRRLRCRVEASNLAHRDLTGLIDSEPLSASNRLLEVTQALDSLAVGSELEPGPTAGAAPRAGAKRRNLPHTFV